MYQPCVHNTRCSSNLKPHQPYPNYIIKFQQPNTKLSPQKKHNPQNKPSALNMHNQNPNITTVQMLMVLLK